ncbi:hypothetical protein [Amycolatopsis sp. lyj-109]|uniref:hypothetical protein n=1 Tax=Amycolatopsis sp. lyj-109 TaxID=2789287 RepID=UPI00397DE3F3
MPESLQRPGRVGQLRDFGRQIEIRWSGGSHKRASRPVTLQEISHVQWRQNIRETDHISP